MRSTIKSKPPASASVKTASQARSGIAKPGNDSSVPQIMSQAGHPLPPQLRRNVETRFGHDFSQVRIHTDDAAAQSATEHLAQAYTVGHHIVFGEGQYAPDDPKGRRLLVHELAHVIQQTRLGPGAIGNTGHEHEADQAAANFSSGSMIAVSQAASQGVQATPLTPQEIAELSENELQARIQANEEEGSFLMLNEEAVDELQQEHTELIKRYHQLHPPESQASTDAPPAPSANTSRGRTGPSGRPATAQDALAFSVRGIQPFGGEIPVTDNSGDQMPIRAGRYILGPNAIECEDGSYATLYYVAYHLDRERNEWTVGPQSVQEFRAAANSYDLRAQDTDDVPTEFGPAIPLHTAQAQANAVQGTTAYYMAESVPRTTHTGSKVSAGGYDLIPQMTHTADGNEVTLYYLARDRESGEDHYIVGSDAVDNFSANADNYLTAGRIAYMGGTPHRYEAESVRWVESALSAAQGEGSWSDAFGHLGNAWGLAVRDPKWQIQAIAAHVPVERAVAPLGAALRLTGRRAAPYVAATMIGLERGLPAVRTGGGGAAITQTLERGVLATETGQVASRPVAEAASQAMATEAAPVIARQTQALAAPMATQAAPSVVSQVTAGGLRSAAVSQAGRIDPEVDAAVERSFVETPDPAGPARSVRPPRVPRSADATQTRDAFSGNLRNQYAQALQVAAFGQVHHAVEVQVLSRYPGVYTQGEINQFQNMRGIPPEVGRRTQLHNSKIREILDRHYVALDAEIARQGLTPGTPEYNALVRRWMDDARAEIDWALGQFFSEQRATMDWTPLP